MRQKGARIVLLQLIALLAWLLPQAALAQAIPTPAASTTDIQTNSATSISGGIAFRAAGAAANANNGGNFFPGLPAGTAANDLLLCVIENRSDVLPTIAAGWTALVSNGTGGNHHAAIYYRIATGVGDAPTVNSTGTNSVAARIYGFSGVDTSNPFDTTSTITSSGSDLTTEAAALTTVTPGAMLVMAAMMADNHTGFSAPTGGGTVDWEGTTATTFSTLNLNEDLSLGIFYGYADAAGTYGPLTMTRTGGANAVSAGALIALRPASTAANFTINKPTSTAQNDVLVASIAVAPNSAAIIPPSGWTEVLALRNNNTTTNQQRVYYKVAGAVEGVSYSWFISTIPTAFANGIAGSIVRFQNVDTTTPIDVFQGQNTLSSTSHATPTPGPTTTVDDVMLVTTHSYAASRNWTPPAGMNELVDRFSAAGVGGGGISLSVNNVIQATPGATGAKTATAVTSSDVGNAQILALRPRVHHFNIVVSGTSACTPTLTVTAQDASNNTVTNYVGTIDLSTSLAHGDWAAGSPAPQGTLSNGTADDGAATYQFASGDAGVVVLKLLNDRSESMTVTVVDSTRASTSTTSASIAFQVKTLAIANDALQIAGKNQAMTTTVRGDGSTCTGFTGSVPVRAWYTPDTDDPGGAAPSISGMASPPLGTSVPGADNVTLSFTNGVANFTLVTTDVGKYVINLRDASATFVATTLDAASPTITTRPFALAFPGIQHSTDQNGTFLAKAGASFSATVRAYLWQGADDSNNDGVPDSGVNVTDNGATPSFAWPVTISAGSSLPSPGTTGNVTRGGGGAATIAQGSFSSGSATASDLEYSEVGNVILVATATNYLNSGVTVSGNSTLDGLGTDYVGRFTPSKFVLTADGANGPVLVNRKDIVACADAATTGTVGAGSTAMTVADGTGFATGDTIVVVGAGTSGVDLVTTVTVAGTNFTLGTPAVVAVTNTPVRKLGFSYMGDRFQVTFRLTAQNLFSNPTNNYTGVYAKLDLSTATSLGLGALNGTTNLTSRLTSSAPGGSFNSSGQADLTVAPTLARATPDAPDGPYDTLRIGIAPDDNDPSGNGTKLASFNLDVDNNATSEHASVGTTRARFGRLRMQSASGSEVIGAILPISAQYWTGSGFATNTLDSCTSLAQSNLALDAYSGAVDPGGGNCKTFVDNAPITLSSGQGTIRFSPPSAVGSLRVTARLGAAGAPANYCDNNTSTEDAASDAANLSPLLGRWDDASDPDGNANTSSDDNPSGRAAFGVYGAQPRNFIFFRENY